VAIGVAVTVGIATLPQANLSQVNSSSISTTIVVVGNSTSTVTLSSFTPSFPTTEGSAATTVSTANFQLASCVTFPSLLKIVPSVVAQPQVASAMSGYSNWVIWGESNESGSYWSLGGPSGSYSDSEITIYSLKAGAPVQCNAGEPYINLQLSLLVPIVNGQYNSSGTQVVQTGCQGNCYAGNNTASSTTTASTT